MKRKEYQNAFLFNANAKSVTPKLRVRLKELIPARDLFFSHNLPEAEKAITTVLERKYTRLFCGGGDGTVINTLNTLNRLSSKIPLEQKPKVGIIRLGTGNALARMLGAQNPETDIKAIYEESQFAKTSVPMVQNEEGLLAPFAGIGYDGEIINDFESIRQKFMDSSFRHVFTSFLGFTLAGLFRTLPRQFRRQSFCVKVKSSKEAFRIVSENGRDVEVPFAAGMTLFEGDAPLICAGSISHLGYGFRMFPFAEKKEGYMQLRICAAPLPLVLSKLYPSVWKGDFRHPDLYDFCVKDVTIESAQELPYQFGGDAMGYRKKLSFRISKTPVEMVRLKNGNLNEAPCILPIKNFSGSQI